MKRRSFVALSCLAMAEASRVAWAARVTQTGGVARAPSRTRLILLGTGGGPRPRRGSAASSQVIVVDDVAYVIDCGDGVARQMVMANVALPTLRHVFITHHHSDHNADYGNLLLLAWASGLRTRVDTWGPPPLERMTQQFLAMNASDIEARIADEKRIPLAPLIHAHDVRDAAVVLQENGVTVTSAIVKHPPMVPSFAYRFDTPDRSIVISGDTSPAESVIALAHNADILVHEAMYPEGVERLAARVPNATDLRRSMISHHTSAEEAGRIAAAAGVKTLVLSHFVPPDDPLITEQMWRDAAALHFKGTIVVGHDLLEL